MAQNKIDNKDVKRNTEEDSVDLSRRRITKTALIASPILASLPGKSALAGNCTSLSGMLSGNLSAPGSNSTACNNVITHVVGWSPGYWRPVCPRSNSFPIGFGESDFLSTFFLPYGIVSPPLGDYTVLEVLWLETTHATNVSLDVIMLTKHTIAAFFSAVYSNQYFIGQDQIIDIYTATINGGVYFEPVTGIQLTGADVIAMYEASYVGSGDIPMSFSDASHCKTDGYKWDDRNGKGHFYPGQIGSGFYRTFADGTKVQWKNR